MESLRAAETSLRHEVEALRAFASEMAFEMANAPPAAAPAVEQRTGYGHGQGQAQGQGQGGEGDAHSRSSQNPDLVGSRNEWARGDDLEVSAPPLYI